jgi:hypothetical protein
MDTAGRVLPSRARWVTSPPVRAARISAVLLAFLLVSACSGGGGSTADTTSTVPGATSTTAAGGIEGVVLERSSGRSHRGGDIDYPGKKPPTGGDHNPSPLTCGVYDQAVPDENAVHSLEHGAVWIAYQPGIADADLATLRALAKGRKVIVAPYAGIDAPIVAVAWEHRLELSGVSDPRLAQFVSAFNGAKTAPEPTAACAGVGTPDR